MHGPWFTIVREHSSRRGIHFCFGFLFSLKRETKEINWSPVGSRYDFLTLGLKPTVSSVPCNTSLTFSITEVSIFRCTKRGGK